MMLVVIIILLGVGIYLHSDYESMIRSIWKVRDSKELKKLLHSAERKKNVSTILLVIALAMTIYQLILL